VYEPVPNYTERRSIQWYGHVVRMHGHRGGQKGEKKRQRKTKEDLGGLCDERKDFRRYEETGLRQNCF
jgi:hypothetical protein